MSDDQRILVRSTLHDAIHAAEAAKSAKWWAMVSAAAAAVTLAGGWYVIVCMEAHR